MAYHFLSRNVDAFDMSKSFGGCIAREGVSWGLARRQLASIWRSKPGSLDRWVAEKLNPIKTVQCTSLSNLVGCRPVTIRNSSPGKSMSPLWAQSKWNLESLGVPSRFAGLPGKSPGLCSTPKKKFREDNYFARITECISESVRATWG